MEINKMANAWSINLLKDLGFTNEKIDQIRKASLPSKSTLTPEQIKDLLPQKMGLNPEITEMFKEALLPQVLNPEIIEMLKMMKK